MNNSIEKEDIGRIIEYKFLLEAILPEVKKIIEKLEDNDSLKILIEERITFISSKNIHNHIWMIVHDDMSIYNILRKSSLAKDEKEIIEHLFYSFCIKEEVYNKITEELTEVLER